MSREGAAMPSANALAPDVSVIVPVYKSEATLAACLDSILCQTTQNIEVICVNDGSPDGCDKILAAYAERDSRISVITQENRGLSGARNSGMEVAHGRIVTFVDSDDLILPNLCERLIRTFDATGAEVVTFGATCEPAEAASKRIQELLSPADAIYEGFSEDLLFRANAQPYAWRTAMTRSFMDRERIRFNETLRFAEDVPYQFTVYPLSRKTSLISDKLYRYQMTDGSLTHVYNASTSRAQKLDQHLCMLQAIFDEWASRGLAGLCPASMVAWCLDLTLFDLARLPQDEATEYASRLAQILLTAYGPDWPSLPAASAVRAAARAVASAAEPGSAFRIGRPTLVRFFMATRGLMACVQRFI